MPNWHIEFEVTAKYLSDAQAAVHSLRGVTGIGVRPIKEHVPSALNGATRPRAATGTVTDAILDAMKGKHKITAKLAYETLTKRGIDTTPKKVSSNLGNMTRRGILRRVGVSEFARRTK